jgi:signal transduction histidine kinase
MADKQEKEATTTTDALPSSMSLDWLVSNLRWVWLFMTLLYVLGESTLAAVSSSYLNQMLMIMGGGFLLNAIYTGLLWAKYYPPWLGAVSVALDTILVITLMLLVEYPQFLLPATLFPVVIAGTRWNLEAALLVVIPLVLGQALLLIPLLQGEIDRTSLITALVTIGANALVMILAGTLPGLFTRRKVDLIHQENAVELEKLRLENARGKLLSEMAMTLSATLNYKKVLRATVDAAFNAMAMTSSGTKDDTAVAMVLLFGDRGMLYVASGRNISRKDQGRKISAEEGIVSRTISTADVLITQRAHLDKSITSFASTPGSRSAICAPLRAGFQTYGVLLFCSTVPDFYNEEHKTMLTAFCSQAIIALQNAQLFEDVHKEQQKILEKESEARRKLARDLHDGPTQSVAAIVMRLNFIKMVIEKGDIEKAYDEVMKVEQIAQDTTTEIRTMLFAMRPVILETQGLVPALDQYADRLNKTEPFQVKVVNRGYEGQLDHEAESVVFAIMEEAVGNAKKHAEATEIRILLLVKAETLYVEIRDNGVGFDVAATQSTYDQRSSLGLINMNERAEMVGGECVLESTPGKGTAVRAKVPFNRAKDI